MVSIFPHSGMAVLTYLGHLFAFLFFLSLADCKTCLKNEDIGYLTGNVYHCDDPTLPECCEMDRQFTCCIQRSTTVIKDQITLWGLVMFFIAAMLLLVCLFRNDLYCFESDTLQQSVRSILPGKNKSKYHEEGRNDKAHLIADRRFNGIANLGEPDAHEYVKNYLMSENGGSYYTKQ